MSAPTSADADKDADADADADIADADNDAAAAVTGPDTPGGPDLDVVDADAHVVEGASLVPAVLAAFPGAVAVRTDGVPGLLIEGRPYPDPEGPGCGCPVDKGLSDAPGLTPQNAAGILRNADQDGIHEMVLFPSFAMCVPSIRDPALGEGIARMYNRWVATLCAEGGGRLHAVAVLPAEHPEAAVRVMTEARELGLVAAVVPPALAERNLDHPDLEPLWAAACDLDLAVGVHGAPGLHLPKIGVDRFTNYVQVHCVSFPFDQMTAMTAIVSGGVLDRHPQLRVAFLESGAGWLPWFVERLGEHFESRGDWIADGWKRHPAEYVAAGNIFVTCEPDEAMLPAVVEQLGPDCVMFASDYPHWDGSWPRSTAKFRAQRLDAAAMARVGAANAQRFYGIGGAR